MRHTNCGVYRHKAELIHEALQSINNGCTPFDLTQ